MSAAETSGRRRALLIASGTYSDRGLQALRSPVGDVRKLGAVLGDAAIGGFDVRAVVDRPTAEVLQAIERFFAEGRRADVLLLYISGHGVIAGDGGLYFTTASTDLKILRSTAVADSFAEARARAYRGVDAIDYADGFHRRDIGWRELERGGRGDDRPAEGSA